ncbi:MAG: hypothetical protein IT249_19520 [Chitinophagaceae bacterium]|nr:hypothetical protein [Chitinophagaceae bacterium]
MRKLLTLPLICCVLFAKSSVPPNEVNSTSFQYLSNDLLPIEIFSDTLPTIKRKEVILIQRSTKLFGVIYIVLPEENAELKSVEGIKPIIAPAANHKPLLKINGNILYDVNYRSRIDTPYAEKDVYQHTLQTRIDILYKDKYPLKLYVTSRFSNTPLFRNYTDFNLRFNPADFKRIAKQQLLEAAKQWLAKKVTNLDSISSLIESKKAAIASLRQSLENPDLKQKIVEDREKEFYSKKHQLIAPDLNDLKDAVIDSASALLENKLTNRLSKSGDSLKTKIDSLTEKYTYYKDSLEKKKEKLDSLERELQKLESQYRKAKSISEQNIADFNRQIENEKDINKLIDRLNLPDTILPKGYKTLSGIQSFNIGRSIADYSELSVKNISITGIQAEYNTGYYYAIAAGKVDYRFRDYIVPNHTRSNQYVALVRFGKGTKSGNHIFLTYYTGKRQLYNASVSTQPNNSIPGYHLAGITIEGLYKLNKNITVVGEIAKSTIPSYSLDSIGKKTWMSSIGKMNSRRNEAYSMRLNSYFPKTLTRFNGYVAYIGANFQSFSTFTTGAAQLRWMARLEQAFFKKQLTIISTVQKNNYSNPFVATSYKSSSLLTSIQANLHIKKYPVVSLGYFPAYQLTKTADDYYSESRYYTLTGSIGHSYKLQQVQLTSYAVYSRFYNEAIDSGFVYYNSKNILLSQSLNFSRFSVLVNGSLSTGNEYKLRMLENSLLVAINKMISVGAGLKMIDYSLLTNMQWGYSGNISLSIPKVGDIQFMADKGFIPGVNKQLADNKTGRLIFYKTF